MSNEEVKKLLDELNEGSSSVDILIWCIGGSIEEKIGDGLANMVDVDKVGEEDLKKIGDEIKMRVMKDVIRLMNEEKKMELFEWMKL